MTNKNIQALIMVPTRELALQTSSIVKEIAKHMKVETMVSTGGTSLRDDIMRLMSEVHVLVGTPGRVLDLAEKDVAKLHECKLMVMDEADKLLSPEFVIVLEKLMNSMPKRKQLCLFSATFPVATRDFTKKFMPNENHQYDG